MRWPNLEIDISEQFQVCVFTMPSSIQLEIVVDEPFSFRDTLLDVIDLEVPGSHVRALTSAATLIKEIPFSKVSFEKRRETHRKRDTSGLTEEQKAVLRKQEEEEELKAREKDWKGFMYVKSEWKGEGPEMPPLRSENVFQTAQPLKNRKDYSEEE